MGSKKKKKTMRLTMVKKRTGLKTKSSKATRRSDSPSLTSSPSASPTPPSTKLSSKSSSKSSDENDQTTQKAEKEEKKLTTKERLTLLESRIAEVEKSIIAFQKVESAVEDVSTLKVVVKDLQDSFGQLFEIATGSSLEELQNTYGSEGEAKEESKVPDKSVHNKDKGHAASASLTAALAAAPAKPENVIVEKVPAAAATAIPMSPMRLTRSRNGGKDEKTPLEVQKNDFNPRKTLDTHAIPSVKPKDPPKNTSENPKDVQKNVPKDLTKAQKNVPKDITKAQKNVPKDITKAQKNVPQSTTKDVLKNPTKDVQKYPKKDAPKNPWVAPKITPDDRLSKLRGTPKENHVTFVDLVKPTKKVSFGESRIESERPETVNLPEKAPTQLDATPKAKPKIGPKSKMSKDTPPSPAVNVKSSNASLVTVTPKVDPPKAQPKKVVQEHEVVKMGEFRIVDVNAIIANAKRPSIPFIHVNTPKASAYDFERPEVFTNAKVGPGPASKRRKIHEDPLIIAPQPSPPNLNDDVQPDSTSQEVSQPQVAVILPKRQNGETSNKTDFVPKKICPFLCNECGLGYYSSLLLTTHKHKVHRVRAKGNEKESPVESTRFSRPDNKSKPVPTPPPSMNKSNTIQLPGKKTCPYCSKLVLTIAFEQHLMDHSEQQLCICSICSKSFFTAQRLDDHMKTHD